MKKERFPLTVYEFCIVSGKIMFRDEKVTREKFYFFYVRKKNQEL